MPTRKKVAEREVAPAPIDTRDILAALGSASAPIIFADEATTFGSRDGVTNITLEADRHMVLPSGMVSDRIAVAHLRLSVKAVQTLRGVLATLDEREKQARRMAN